MRGCVANLGDEDKNHCLENDNTCKTCFKNGCNKRLAFAECLATNGVVHVTYIPTTNDDQVFTKTCKMYNDSCFVLAHDLNGVIRDCFNEYVENNAVTVNFLTEGYNASSYEVCSEPLCNDHDVRPVHCISCDSRYDENCTNTTLSERKRCFLEVNPSGCYHFEGDHIERGCIFDLDDDKRKLCESDSETCKKCIGNECNSRIMLQKCLATDRLSNLNYDFSKTCKRYTDECFIHVSNNNTRRGCLNDLIDSPVDGIDIVEDCKNDEICEKCSDRPNCNDRQFESEHCIVCSSKDDLRCFFNPESLEVRKKCPLALKQMGCYLRKDGGLHAERGCMSQLEPNERNDCRRRNSTCKMCWGDSCNEKRYFQSCAECNSLIDGEDCINKAYIAKSQVCEDYHGECYTHVQNGGVVRNCTGDATVPDADTCKANPDSCQLCSDSGNCNDKTITSLTCISCDSSVDRTCATNTTFDQVTTCAISIHEPSCYHFIDDDLVHRRGKLFDCDINEYGMNEFENFSNNEIIFCRCEFYLGCTNQLPKPQKERCERNEDECKICTEDNCNKKSSFERCFHCNSTRDSTCLTALAPTKSKICKNYDDECYTRIGDFDIERGCLANQNIYLQNKCRSNKNKCSTCHTNQSLGCNDHKIEMEYCAHCNSEDSENCRDKPELYKNKVCSQFNFLGETGPRQGCYMFEVCSSVLMLSY